MEMNIAIYNVLNPINILLSVVSWYKLLHAAFARDKGNGKKYNYIFISVHTCVTRDYTMINIAPRLAEL